MYARRMEYLARVHDGSEGTLANGYWTCSVIGVEGEGGGVNPLNSRLYSQAGPDFQSENAEIRKAISFVAQHTEKRGIWVLDRGGDRREIIHHVLRGITCALSSGSKWIVICFIEAIRDWAWNKYHDALCSIWKISLNKRNAKRRFVTWSLGIDR
jgi:hypothetical protein